MHKKPKLLFVIESLTLAGSEKSLLTLLKNIDADQYDIDLQLFHYGGELQKFLPKHITILPPLPVTNFAKSSWSKKIKNAFFSNKTRGMLIASLRYSYNLRTKETNHSEKATIYWKLFKSLFKKVTKQYDVAIAYAQGLPTFYVLDKITAKRKVCWVNANMQFTDFNLRFQEAYYTKYDRIVPVSLDNESHFAAILPNLKSKFFLIPDMVDYQSIVRMSQSKIDIWDRSVFNILTVSRLESGMKGMDILIDTIRILRNRNILFKWYLLGKGSFEAEMQKFITTHGLEDKVCFLGTDSNPYPYYKQANLYVQTSRSESFGLSIAEARLLNIPVVTTRFDTVFMQMIDCKNGLVTDMNAEAVAVAIIRLMEDKTLYNSIVEYLKNEQKENTETVEKFDQMIAELLSTD